MVKFFKNLKKMNIKIDKKILEKMKNDQKVHQIVRNLIASVSGLTPIHEDMQEYKEDYSYFLKTYVSEIEEVKKLYDIKKKKGLSRDLMGKISQTQADSVFPLLEMAGFFTAE